MRINVTTSGGRLCARVGDSLDISTAREGLEHLGQVLGPGRSVEYNLSSVSELDMAGAQVLLHLRREASRLGAECVFSHPSEAVREVFGLLRRTDLFDEPILTV
jgi:anti-anti-sigma regulatory factor